MANSPHPSPSMYTKPVPGGTVGRTDQGVDISGAPGTPVFAIANETLVGIIQNWYNGQPYYWFRIQGTNIYNYVAEQFSSRLQIGESVQQGQQIGEIAPSGTGLELGWATASGKTLARATTGYTEGQETPAGQSYRTQVIDSGGGVNSSLAALWIQAGGSPALANTMAAIAMAESGGNVGAQNPSGAAGLWQILPSAHPQYDVNRLLSDPLYNAQAAVAVEKSQGLSAWTTYTSGAYRQFLGKPDLIQGYGGTRPGGGPDTGGSSGGSGNSGQANLPGLDQMFNNYVSLRDMPRTAPPSSRNTFQWWWQSFSGRWNDLNSASEQSAGAGQQTAPAPTTTTPPQV